MRSFFWKFSRFYWSEEAGSGETSVVVGGSGTLGKPDRLETVERADQGRIQDRGGVVGRIGFLFAGGEIVVHSGSLPRTSEASLIFRLCAATWMTSSTLF